MPEDGEQRNLTKPSKEVLTNTPKDGEASDDTDVLYPWNKEFSKMLRTYRPPAQIAKRPGENIEQARSRFTREFRQHAFDACKEAGLTFEKAGFLAKAFVAQWYPLTESDC